MTLPLATLGGADLIGLLIAACICVYLVYALLRGENL